MIVWYRMQQGVWALLAFTQTVDEVLAQQHLNEAQWALFCQMSHSEQLHSLNVLRTVLAQASETPSDLAVAALMHDVGKSRYHMSVLEKTLVTLIKTFLLGWFQQLSEADKVTTWRAPFAVYRYHPDWGAELMSEADSTERTLWLVAHHQDAAETWHNHPNYPLLLRLQAADDVN